jgi:DHA3 family macrolide efflux protein-like MFS transporter
VDVVTAAIAVGLLLTLTVPPLVRTAGSENAGYFDDLISGLKYIRRNRTVRTLFIFFAFVFFLVTPAAFLTPLLVTRTFGDEVWRLTANEVSFSAGAIIGGFILMAWGGFKNHFRTIGLGSILWAVLFVGIGFSQSFILYLVFMFLSGIPMPFFNVSTTTLLQEKVQPDMQGRVFSVQLLIMNTVMPLGMLLFGPIADQISIQLVLIIASGLIAAPGLWLFLNPRGVVHQPARGAAIYDVITGD